MGREIRRTEPSREVTAFQDANRIKELKRVFPKTQEMHQCLVKTIDINQNIHSYVHIFTSIFAYFYS